jgi:hypothetical protein
MFLSLENSFPWSKEYVPWCVLCVLCAVCCSRVSPEDIQQCEDRFNKSKMVHSIMRHVAETTGENLEVRQQHQLGRGQQQAYLRQRPQQQQE